jgi:putative ABC transport system substrate-binding protein
MRRRAFISLLGGGAAAAWPLAAHAQEPGRIYRLGFLVAIGRQTSAVLALFDELRLNGFVEGKNLTIISKGFEADRAAALVNAGPDDVSAIDAAKASGAEALNFLATPLFSVSGSRNIAHHL